MGTSFRFARVNSYGAHLLPVTETRVAAAINADDRITRSDECRQVSRALGGRRATSQRIVMFMLRAITYKPGFIYLFISLSLSLSLLVFLDNEIQVSSSWIDKRKTARQSVWVSWHFFELHFSFKVSFGEFSGIGVPIFSHGSPCIHNFSCQHRGIAREREPI